MLTLRTMAAEPSTDPLGLFMECHERIRRFCRLAVRIASEPAPEKDVQDAAFAVHRYFHKALPLHIEDEDLSLLPELEQVGDVALKSALERMSGEHEPLDQRIEALIPLWRVLIERPSELVVMGPELLVQADVLEREMLAHLEHEETVIFPAARNLLGEKALFRIANDMRDRRRPGP